MDRKSASNGTTIAAGALTVLTGMVPLLAALGVLPRGTESVDPAPSWMGWLIGAMFVSGGLIVIARGVWGSESDGTPSLRTPWPLRAAYDVLAGGIACALAVLLTWVAFGPGPRHFSVGMGGRFVSASGDTTGRAAFGIGAALAWCVAVLMMKASVRRWRS